jgi:serine protease Do
LAVISVSLSDITDEMSSQIKVATIGDSSNLVLGEEVVAIGNALGYGQSVTTGIISALNREVTLTDDDGGTITNKLIQTDAAINPGNSGGALLNMKGELIGINSAKVSSDSVEGMGYAIPISDVHSIIEELMLKETRDVVADDAQGYIGITGTDVTSDIAETYDMPIGIYVSTVADDSPAKEAGLTKGIIITKFDGQTVKSMSELKNLLTYYKAGETVNITAQVPGTNGYEERIYSITLGFKQSSSDSGNSEQQQQQQQQEQPSNGGNGNYYNNPFGYFFP